MKSLPGNLLFAHGCVPAHVEAAWYHILDVSIAVYATATGKPVFAARSVAGSDLRNAFARSPSGASLTVLGPHALQIYSLAPVSAAK